MIRDGNIPRNIPKWMPNEVWCGDLGMDDDLMIFTYLYERRKEAMKSE